MVTIKIRFPLKKKYEISVDRKEDTDGKMGTQRLLKIVSAIGAEMSFCNA